MTPPPIHLDANTADDGAKTLKNLATNAGYLTAMGGFCLLVWKKLGGRWVWQKTLGRWITTRRAAKEDRVRERELISGIHATVGELKEGQELQNERLDDLSDGVTQLRNFQNATLMDAPDAHFTTNHMGHCTSVNKAYERLTGWTLADVQGFGWKNVIHPEELEETERWWSRIIRDQTHFAARDAVYIRPDGTAVAVHVTVRGISGRYGITQWMGVAVMAGTLPDLRVAYQEPAR